MQGAVITKNELFARLADGQAAGVTVVTPNRRLARALASRFDTRRIAQGLATWESADILPVSAFVERAHEDALDSELAADVPLLLTPAEEQCLWEDAVRGSEAGSALLALPETASLAREAWQLAHAWRLWDALARGAPNEDAQAFVGWAGRVARATERARRVDPARLPDLVARLLAEPAAKKPRLLVRYGFDLVTPQQDDLFAALERTGVELADCAPERRDARVLRVACADAREEFRLAARWVRARLETNPTARIGVVVPDLARERDAIRRVLADTMAPGAADPRAAAGPLAYNVSLGEPLAAHPLVAHALLVLELCGREIEFERASIVLRSPFVAGGENESGPRARLDAKLRRRAEPLLTLERLMALAFREDLPRCPALARTLAALAAFRKERLFGAQPPRAWSEAFIEALRIAGFPGERALDSAEYQTLKKWHETLAQLARLDRVTDRMRFAEALARLRRIAGETLFQPETAEAPIQVLGVLEAAGMEFDHLWVMGLSDEAWPMPPHANPFIPIRLQRDAGVPNASPAAALDSARRFTAGWLACAGEVVLSHPRRQNDRDDRDLAASPLIAQVGEGRLELPEYEGWREVIHRAQGLERLEDARAPALRPGGAAQGGAALVKDQAACPFKALAVHRLGAEGLEAPHTGLDAMERGTLVHRVLAAAWRELKTKAALDATAEPALETLLARAADEAIAWQRRDRPTTLAGRFAAIERARLVRLACAWLEHEKKRPGFAVIAVEDKRALALGPLAFNLRLDRVDETGEGLRIVIDYKTSRPTLSSMLGERPDEPQLPLYVTAAEPQAAAAAFAQVRAGDMKFVGLARDEGVLEGAKTAAAAAKSGAEPSWGEQIAFWRRELERLVEDHARGRAEVDPKRRLDTCRHCGVQPLCRVFERIESTLGAGVE
jgi:probable DNA repair protein